MLGSINPLASSLNIQSTASTTATTATDSTAVHDASATANAEVKPRAARGAAAPPAAESDDSSDMVKQLKKHIAELQKQLQQQMQELQKIQASTMSAEAKMAAVAGAQAQIAATVGALQEATAALLQALTAQGSSGSGSMVSTSVIQPARGACIAGKPGSHREKMSVADPSSKQAGRSAASAAFDLPAPSGGREEVLRSGPPGMDAGRAAMGQGWPVAACPRSGTGTREPERSEGRTPGASLFGYFFGVWKK